MFLRTREGAGVTTSVGGTEDTIIHYVITFNNRIWSRNIAIKKNGKKETDCFWRKISNGTFLAK